MSEIEAPDAAATEGPLTRWFQPLMLLMSAAFAWQPLVCYSDFWSHAAVGRWIWQHHAVPHQTILLWAPRPVEWTAHSWLTQLLFYGIMSAGGDQAGPYLALALTVVTVGASFAILWRLWQRRGRITVLTPFVFSLAIQASWPRFGTRPELWTGLFLSYLLFVFCTRHEAVTEAKAQRRIWLLVPMSALWANLHGAVAVGLVLLAVTALIDAAQDRLDRRARELLIVTAACVAAVFINPYGASLWKALLALRTTTFSYLIEWKSPFAPPFLPLQYVIDEALLLLLALGAWGLNPQRRWAQLLWLLLGAGAFYSSRRYQWILALVCVAVTAANAPQLDTARIWQELRRRWQRAPEVGTKVYASWRLVLHIGVVLCLVLWILTPASLFPFRATARNLPTACAAFIEENGIHGNMFADMGIGCYLQWRFGESRPVYIDVQNAYPPVFYDVYSQMMNARPNTDRWLAPVDYAVLAVPFDPMPPSPLITHLRGAVGDWALVYLQEDGAVFVRRKPQFRDVIARYEIKPQT